MNVPILGKQPQRNTVHGRIPPALVEEPLRAVQTRKVRLVGRTAKEVQVADLKVAPEVTGAVAVGLGGDVGPGGGVGQPVERVVRTQILGMLRQEGHGLGPQRGQRVGVVVDVDREAVRLVVVRHEPEDVVVDVAEESAGSASTK